MNGSKCHPDTFFVPIQENEPANKPRMRKLQQMETFFKTMNFIPSTTSLIG